MVRNGLRAAWVLLAVLALAAPAGPASAQSTCDGRWYRVQQGDSWSKLAQRTGLPAAALKAANPAAASHPQGWLIVGQTLCLPQTAAAPAEVAQPAGSISFPVTVRRGDSWAVLAGRYGVSVAALQAANPRAVRAGQVLRPGDRILVPITSAMTERYGCPEDLAETARSAAQVMTEWNGSMEVLQSYLTRCGVLAADRGDIQRAALRGAGEQEVVLALVHPQAGDGRPLGIVAALGAGPLGWEVVHLSGLAAEVDLLALGDVNDDGNPDIVWSDTTCGARACFTTPHVTSFVDGDFRPWVNGSTTMASAAVRLEDVMPQGSGQELVMQGGVIGAVAAGPQRPVTSQWASLGGGPYVLVQQSYAPSFCLYHHILDADAAMRSGAQDNYAAAIAAYRAAADDPRLTACWIRPTPWPSWPGCGGPLTTQRATKRPPAPWPQLSPRAGRIAGSDWPTMASPTPRSRTSHCAGLTNRHCRDTRNVSALQGFLHVLRWQADDHISDQSIEKPPMGRDLPVWRRGCEYDRNGPITTTTEDNSP